MPDLPRSILGLIGSFLAAVVASAALATSWETGGLGEQKRALQGASTERPACAACHMADGSGQPEVGIPRLAGLSADYIARQLAWFADSTRRNVVMQPYAAALSDDERHAYGKYFAKQRAPRAASPFPVDASAVARGRQLFADGEPRIGLVACAQCHGPTGLGVGDFSPRIAGQSAAYVLEQLEAWHAGATRDPDGRYMQAIAARLSPDDMKSVAAYIATMTTEGGKQP